MKEFNRNVKKIADWSAIFLFHVLGGVALEGFEGLVADVVLHFARIVCSDLWVHAEVDQKL